MFYSPPSSSIFHEVRTLSVSYICPSCSRSSYISCTKLWRMSSVQMLRPFHAIFRNLYNLWRKSVSHSSILIVQTFSHCTTLCSSHQTHLEFWIWFRIFLERTYVSHMYNKACIWLVILVSLVDLFSNIQCVTSQIIWNSDYDTSYW